MLYFTSVTLQSGEGKKKKKKRAAALTRFQTKSLEDCRRRAEKTEGQKQIFP